MIKLIIILILNIVLFNYDNVSASNVAVTDYISGVYYNVQVGDYYYSYNEPYIRINGDLVYCLEPEMPLNEKVSYEVGLVSDINISGDVIKKVELIGHYGYGYKNHDDYKYYLATQELIWRTTRPNVIMSWATEQYGTNLISVEKEKEEIMYLVNNHNNLSNINGRNITLGLDESYTWYGDKLLKYFEVVDSGPHSISINDKKLIIKTSKDYIGKSNIILKKIGRNESGKTTIYKLNGYQSLIYIKNTDEITMNFSIDIKVGSITINKIDSETKKNIGQGDALLEGTTYEVYDKNFNCVDTLVIGANGKAKTGNLNMGEYFIKEVKSGKGYLLDLDMRSLMVGLDNLNPVITWENKVIKSKVIFNKTYGVENFPERGAIFEIIDSHNNKVQIITNSNGKVSIDLPYGKYIVKQIKGIKNYDFVEDFIIDINENSSKEIIYNLNNKIKTTSLIINKIDSITNNIIYDEAIFKIFDVKENKYLNINNTDLFKTKDGYVEINNIKLGEYIIEEIKSPKGYQKYENIKINLSEDDIFENKIIFSYPNELILGKIKINKKGLDLGQNEVLLSDVVFGIYAKEDVIVNKKVIYKKDELIEEVITSEGLGLSKYLPIGSYYVKELVTNEGYILDENIYEIKIEENKEYELDLVNELILGKIRINKKGIDLEENEVLLSDVVFGVYAKEDVIVNKKVIYKKDELVEEVITSEGFCLSKYLPIGSYYVKELVTNEGYILDENIYEIKIEENKEYELDLVNELILGRIRINKKGLDLEENEVLLSDVVFGVYAKEDVIVNKKVIYKKDELIEEVITSEGLGISKYLPIGSYYVKELVTNEEYILDENIYCLDIKNIDTIDIEFLNYKKPIYIGNVEIYDVPDTLINQVKLNKFGMFLFLMIGYIIIKYAKV